MINSFKHIIFCLVLLLILGMEQALGLPNIFVISVLFLAQAYKGYKQIMFLVLMGLALGIFYELKLFMAVIAILIGQLIILSLASKIKSEGFRILLTSLLVLLFLLFKIGFSFSPLLGIFYNLVVFTTITIIFFILRRRRKTLSLSKRLL